MQTDPIVIVGAARTPTGGFQGELSGATAPELGGVAIKAALERAGVAPEDVDDVIMGLCLFAGVKQAPARQAAHNAGIPWDAGCTTISKMCGSGMKAAMLAHDNITVGTHDIMVAGGMESMTNAPYLLEKARDGIRMGHGRAADHMFVDGLEDAFDEGRLMGTFAEDTAQSYQFTREQQDEFAITSLKRAKTAIEDGTFNDEVEPVTMKTRRGEKTVERDEQPLTANLEKIPQLKPAFRKDGTVTPANSSSISDGGAALVLMRRSEAEKRGLTPRAILHGHATHAQEPAWFTTAPIGAVNKLLEGVGWETGDVGPLRGQRSLRRGHHGRHARSRHPPRQGQRPRRRLRAGAPGRRVWGAHHRHAHGRPRQIRSQEGCCVLMHRWRRSGGGGHRTGKLIDG